MKSLQWTELRCAWIEKKNTTFFTNGCNDATWLRLMIIFFSSSIEFLERDFLKDAWSKKGNKPRDHTFSNERDFSLLKKNYISRHDSAGWVGV